MSTSSSEPTIEPVTLASASEKMDSLINATMQQKAKEQGLVDQTMERYTRNIAKKNQIAAQPTYAQVAQPRLQRSDSTKTVTNWPEVPESERFVEPPYTNPYDRGISQFPALAPSVKKPSQNPSRQDSPFADYMSQISNAKEFLEEVNKNPELVFDTICQIVSDEDAATEAMMGENQRLREENSNLKGNWMDIRDQTLANNQALISTQEALSNAIRNKENVQKELEEVQEQHNQRRLDWNNRAERYEELLAIQKSKQVLLWKLIERLQNGTLSEEEMDLELTIPPWTGTKKTSGLFDTTNRPGSVRSDSLVRGGPGSPERPFNPTANAFVPSSAPPAKRAMSIVSSAELPPVDVLSCILSLPPRFYGICPNSLCASTEGKCFVPTCRLQHVCEAYNDEKGDGCHQNQCKFVHEFRSCRDEIDGWGCRYKGGWPDGKVRKAHMDKRVHENFCAAEEWRSRVIIAGLRISHQEGKY